MPTTSKRAELLAPGDTIQTEDGFTLYHLAINSVLTEYRVKRDKSGAYPLVTVNGLDENGASGTFSFEPDELVEVLA